LSPSLFREIKIEEKEMRPGESSVLIHLIYKGYALFPVIEHFKVEFETGLLERFSNEKHVWFSVLD